MLSRDANSLYWMSRYIERAENLSRLVDVADQSLLDSGMAPEDQFAHFWRPILAASAQESLFTHLREADPELDVAEFFTSASENRDSIQSCVATARENARTVRDHISDELWRDLNALHLYLSSTRSEVERRESPQAFYQRIRRSSLLFQGIADATIPHREGWNFMRLGRYLERADKTSRILDIKNHTPRAPGEKPAISWGTVLRCCSAQSAHRQEFGSAASATSVAQLLVFSREFPRSIRYCIGALDEALHAITGVAPGQFCNEPERLTGGTLARLNFSSSAEAFDRGLNQFVDDLQLQFNAIGQSIFETYVLLPAEIGTPPAIMSAHQQQQQQ